MSLGIKTKHFITVTRRSFWASSLAIILLFSAYGHNSEHNQQAQLLSSCMAVQSELPRNHSSHPCQATYMSNKNWWSWLSGESKSPQLHFLDLVELIHYSFH